MTTPTTLIERIRYALKFGSNQLAIQQMLCEAIYEIERINQELNLAHKAINDACDDANHNADQGIEWLNRAKKAEALAAKYREVLATIISTTGHWCGSDCYCSGCIARAALAADDASKEIS